MAAIAQSAGIQLANPDYRIATFAEYHSRGEWVRRPYLEYLLDGIQPLLVKGGARIRVHMPARHGKSEACTRWTPTWFLRWFPDRHVILTSYNGAKALDWSVDIREHFKHEPPDSPARVRPDVSAKQKWQNVSGGGLVATGSNGPITGRGADLFVTDDPHKDWKDATSPKVLEHYRQWIPKVAKLRIEPGGSWIVAMTRWHSGDFARLLDDHADWTDFVLPALAEEGDPLGRELDEPLDPDRYDFAHFDDFRRRDPETHSAMNQQRPMTEGGSVWSRDWFRIFDPERPPADLRRHCQSWDLTFKETRKGSYVVGQIWARRRDSMDCYFLHQIRRRMDFVPSLDAVRHMTRAHPKATAKLVEAKANGDALMNTLRRELGGFIPCEPNGSKEDRARAVAPLIRGGNVYIPDPRKCPWVSDFLEEAAQFPHGAHDDQVDAASQALDYLTAGAGFRVGVA